MLIAVDDRLLKELQQFSTGKFENACWSISKVNVTHTAAVLEYAEYVIAWADLSKVLTELLKDKMKTEASK